MNKHCFIVIYKNADPYVGHNVRLFSSLDNIKNYFDNPNNIIDIIYIPSNYCFMTPYIMQEYKNKYGFMCLRFNKDFSLKNYLSKFF